MTENISDNNNKKTSFGEYDELIKRIKEDHAIQAREYIPRLCYALKEEDSNLSNEDIKERIKKDLVDVWSLRTVYENIPEEFKDEQKQEAGKQKKKSAAVVQQKDTEERPITISLTTNGKPSNYDEEVKQIYHDPERNNNNNHQTTPNVELLGVIKDKDLEIGRLKEQMQEQKQHIDELIKSVNAATSIKQADKSTTPVTQTLEYKTLLAEKSILDERVNELEQLLKRDIQTNPAIGFQTASKLKQSPIDTLAAVKAENEITTITHIIPNEIHFPASKIGRFFIEGRNVKDKMILHIDENAVVTGWTVS